MKKVLITGANGMLGSTLCDLFHQNYEVIALHRDADCYSSSATNYSLELDDLPNLESLFKKLNPDIVIHAAGATNVEECEKKPDFAYRNNVIVTEQLAHLCGSKTKLIYISTDQVYGDVKDCSENNLKLEPINQYGKSKYLGEQRVLESSQDNIIIRTNIFGWNKKPGKVSSAEWIYNTLRNKELITLFNDYTFHPIFAEDLGLIIVKLLDLDYKGVINVGSPSPCTKYEFGNLLAEKCGFSKSNIKIGSIEDHHFEAPRVKHLSLDIEKLQSLGIKAPDFEQSIEHFSKNAR